MHLRGKHWDVQRPVPGRVTITLFNDLGQFTQEFSDRDADALMRAICQCAHPGCLIAVIPAQSTNRAESHSAGTT